MHQTHCIVSDTKVFDIVKRDMQSILSSRAFVDFIHMLMCHWRIGGLTYMECIVEKINDNPHIFDIHMARKVAPRNDLSEREACFIYLQPWPSKSHSVNVILDYSYGVRITTMAGRRPPVFAKILMNTKFKLRVATSITIYINDKMYTLPVWPVFFQRREHRDHMYTMLKYLIGLVILLILMLVCTAQVGMPWSYTHILKGSRKWNVVSDYENSDAAAQLIARTNATLIEFMRTLKRKYHIDEPDDIIAEHAAEHQVAIESPNDLYNIVDHLLDNYNPDSFYENDPRRSQDTSYTINKGDAMYICLRQRSDPRRLVDENTLLFTMLHEIAHIANYRGWGHGNDFWACFKFILHEAQLAGIYHPVDYAKHPVDFCGLLINWNPLFDDSVQQLWLSN
jgi:hypothetical protein